MEGTPQQLIFIFHSFYQFLSMYTKDYLYSFNYNTGYNFMFLPSSTLNDLIAYRWNLWICQRLWLCENIWPYPQRVLLNWIWWTRYVQLFSYSSRHSLPEEIAAWLAFTRCWFLLVKFMFEMHIIQKEKW